MLSNQKGLSFIELVVTLVILSVLASLILPMAQMTNRRIKEIELRRNLRIIRSAIDEFKKNYDKAVEEKKIIPSLNKNPNGYPEDLKQLVDGYDFGGLYGYPKKFLRRIPVDPFAPPGSNDPKDPQWGMRSSVDPPDSGSWGREDLFDVYSLSEETAIDGTKYKDW